MSSQNPPSKEKSAERWERVARRIRVPLGFVVAALYVFELLRRAPEPVAIAWSLALVLPGLWLRGYAAGYVKKNRELTQTGPYAYTRNPLYLGTAVAAAGFALINSLGSIGSFLAPNLRVWAETTWSSPLAGVFALALETWLGALLFLLSSDRSKLLA